MSPASSSSSAYAFKPGGSLKFKGGDSLSSSKKKKKKSRSSTSIDTLKKSEASGGNAERNIQNGDDDEGDDGERNKNQNGHTMTEAEQNFEDSRRKRMAERVKKQAKLSHKDRVDAFNRDLESRTEHFAMGRVGGGG
ncbi:hypothetical protein CBS101457_003868 [Exobasidium rhododendri]|nr:hypothetical protein CBS101457_003868 [Exobasidium rhododendri]